MLFRMLFFTRQIEKCTRRLPEESDDSDAVRPRGFVFPLFPFRQGAVVHTQDSLAFVRQNLQIEPALFDLLADMPWLGRIPIRFP